MNHLKRIAFVVIVAGLLSACTHIVSDFKSGASIHKSSIQTKTGDLTFVFSGIAQTKTVDASRICGGQDKVVKVKYVRNFIDAFLASITLGLYTPISYKVYCIK